MGVVLQHWEFFAFLATWAVGSISAAVTLHHRVQTNKDAISRAFTEIGKLQAKTDYMDSETVKELKRISESLARVEGFLSGDGKFRPV